MYRPTANGFFSGCGGMEIGMMQAGIQVQSSLDIDKTATDCMLANPKYFGGKHKVLNMNIANKLALEDEMADIAIGTYPCTRYSNIASIHDKKIGDELYLHFLRMVVLRSPEAYVLENVPGMKMFPVVMEAMTRLPDYYVTIFCPLDASMWLPQKRKRLIIIGTKRPLNVSHPKKGTRRKLMRDIIERDVPPMELPDYVVSRITGKYRDKPIIIDPNDPNALAPTCVAHYSKDLGTRMVLDPSQPHGLRPFTIREYARLQGFPDDFEFPESGSAYRLIGNAVPVDMGRWAGEVLLGYFNRNRLTRSLVLN